jgi:hypothetical protein
MHITQNEKSIKVLQAIKDYFGCGIIKIDNKLNNTMRYQVNSYKDINNIIIPFLDKYPLLTSKYLNYLDFKKAINLMLNKEHLTKEGINKFKILANQMNSKRSFSKKFNRGTPSVPIEYLRYSL